jgi:hypothetical protein
VASFDISGVRSSGSAVILFVISRKWLILRILKHVARLFLGLPNEWQDDCE